MKHEEKTYLDARKFTNTVQLLLSANKASLWIDVLGGRTPFANLEIIVRGKDRSYYSTISNFDLDFHRFLVAIPLHSILRVLDGQRVQAIPHRHL